MPISVRNYSRKIDRFPFGTLIGITSEWWSTSVFGTLIGFPRNPQTANCAGSAMSCRATEDRLRRGWRKIHTDICVERSLKLGRL
jgi:hypothetical protein